MKELGVKQKPVCAECGSDDVTLDAVARWDEEKQDWALSSTFDDAYCGACEQADINLKWENIK